MRQLKPDFQTIADFRHDNRKPFRAVFGQFVLLCKSRQGGGLGAPAWSAALPTQDAAIAAGQAAEQQWFETYDTERAHAAEQEIGM